MERIHDGRSGWFLLIHVCASQRPLHPPECEAKGHKTKELCDTNPTSLVAGCGNDGLSHGPEYANGSGRGLGAARVLEALRDLACDQAGSSPRTTSVVSRFQTLRAEEAHRRARAQGPYPLRQVLCRCKQEEDRVRSPQAGLENVKCEPGSTFTSARRRWSNRRNFPGRRKQQL
jgi:hypothetical protein